jgi:hypothetical protein
MKGQAPQALAMSVVILAASIAVGLVIYDALYRAAVSERFDSESIGNYTTKVDWSFETMNDTVDHTPFYFRPTRADGTANATAVVVQNDASSQTLTLTCCVVDSANEFNSQWNGQSYIFRLEGVRHSS